MHTIDKTATAKAKELLTYKTTRSLGIVLHGFSASELAFEIIHSTNEYLKTHSDIDIYGFAMNRELPILPPKFAIFPSLDLVSSADPIVATDIPTWQASLNSVSTQKYLYIYDILRLNNVPRELVQKINESGFQLVPRTKNYADSLKKLGYLNIMTECMPRFNIERLIEIIWPRK